MVVIIEDSMNIHQKIKNLHVIQQFRTGCFLKENKNVKLKMYMQLSVHCSIICNSQDMEAT